MKKTLVTLAALGTLLGLSIGGVACSDEEGATHALRAEGFKNIVTTGYSWGCGKDDGTCTGFEATGPSGERVEGAGGCGSGCGRRAAP